MFYIVFLYCFDIIKSKDMDMLAYLPTVWSRKIQKKLAQQNADLSNNTKT